jgi:hypothetical protein
MRPDRDIREAVALCEPRSVPSPETAWSAHYLVHPWTLDSKHEKPRRNGGHRSARAIVALWRVATGLSRVRRGHLAGSGDGTVVHQFTSTPCAVGALGPACARARTQEPRARTQELRVGTVNGRETRAEMVSLASAAEAGHNERSANLVTMPHGCERHSSAPKTPVRLNPLTF